MSNLLERSSYNLVDYPPVLHRYLVEQNLLADPKMALKTIGDKSLLAAAEGFGELIEGRRTEAAGLFEQAYRDNPNDACLPYYLAQTTSGFASVQALRRAADLGYWHAQLLLSRFNARRADR